LAALLARQVGEVRAGVQILHVGDYSAALAQCRQRLPELLIADEQLPGASGMDLLRLLRLQTGGESLPFILVNAPMDAASVRAAVPLVPAAYLGKPLGLNKLRHHLSRLLAAPAKLQEAQPPTTLASYLDSLRERGTGAPLLADVAGAIDQCLDTGQGTFAELQRGLAADAQGATRLAQARSANLLLGLALERQTQLADGRLAKLAMGAWRQAQRTAELAAWLADELALDARRCYTAGLLHNVGELALLRCLQRWLDAGGPLSDAELQQAMAERAPGFGSALRIRWRLPLALRELIAAAYALGSGVFSREALVLHLTRQVLTLPSHRAPLSLQEERASRLLRIRPDLLDRLPLDSLPAAS
jgi:DNA-binding response OmpR family regulator